MEDYRKGCFGEKPLSMEQILDRAGHKDIFNRMDEEDILTLIRESTGMSKMAYSMALEAKRNKE